MTDQQHPITPPPELVREWNEAAIGTHFPPYGYSEYIATQAARWGADQELEACCADIHTVCGQQKAVWLRSMRRPKPPSLKEQALEILGYPIDFWSEDEVDTIRRALEQLDD